ncbi:MAG: dienelactone hydrolase family protein [Pirellulales bacterium]|nr:dienelactone hydrolase family protein [Pirellulales bacterium]
MSLSYHRALVAVVVWSTVLSLSEGPFCLADELGAPLAGTRPLEMQGDIASQLVEGVDRFLLKQIDDSVEARAAKWQRDLSSREKYEQSVESNRQRLARFIGAVDERTSYNAPEIIVEAGDSITIARNDRFQVTAIRWPAFGDVHGEGLLLTPTKGKAVADIVAIPDADVTPEQLAGLEAGVPAESLYARRLAESGCRVVVPMLINRHHEGLPGQPRSHKLTNRELLYRSTFEMGRHLIGYEVQKVLAAVDWFARDAGKEDANIGVIGWGEGGLVALHAAALDPRIDAACVSGYFDSRQKVWDETLDRNVFHRLAEFGDAELASLIAPRTLVVEACRGVEFEVPPGTGGGPGKLTTPDLASVEREVVRARQLSEILSSPPTLKLVTSKNGFGPHGTPDVLTEFLAHWNLKLLEDPFSVPPSNAAPGANSRHAARHRRQMHEIDRHTQQLLNGSAEVRKKFFAQLDTSSLEKYAETIEPYREYFRDEVVGSFDLPLLPANPRSRQIFDEPEFTGYEVVLDVWPDVFAYGILLVPKGIQAGERRPVVVCQHGLEGRPRDVADPSVQNPAYHQYAVQLAKRGFVTFAPQNLYIFQDRFRTLQRKANTLGKTLFSVIVPQHQQIVDWLAGLPMVDPEQIAFYGLSYGGKSAMRIPPLVKGYCLSICSADFNEWVWKNMSTTTPYSYVWTGEYEIFEFDLGQTFNYAEMAALIAPRPFMVERGHFDGVAPDEEVAYEYAKVRHLYAAKLGIGDRTEIEFFVGPHTINGKGTFAFLHQHLKWPEPN